VDGAVKSHAGIRWCREQLNGRANYCKEADMAKNEKTSKRAGTAASKTLKAKGTTKDAKTAAGSALTQRPNKAKGAKKK
jgi:hypothetical protein